MSEEDISNLCKFQRYAGRRFQRYKQSPPSFSSYYGVGWMGITSYICIKKLMFAFTMVLMGDDSTIKMLFKQRAKDFNDNIRKCMFNEYRSPTYEILKVAINLGLYADLMNLLFARKFNTKTQWKEKVWKTVRDAEDVYWDNVTKVQKTCKYLHQTMGNPRYLTWWYMADLHLLPMYKCEDMARLVCNTSNLKCDNILLKNEPFGSRMCINCELGIEENIFHLVMQCPASYTYRVKMFREINDLPNDIGSNAIRDPTQTLLILLGKCATDYTIEQMIPIWTISAEHISAMYIEVIRNRMQLNLQLKN